MVPVAAGVLAPQILVRDAVLEGLCVEVVEVAGLQVLTVLAELGASVAVGGDDDVPIHTSPL